MAKNLLTKNNLKTILKMKKNFLFLFLILISIEVMSQTPLLITDRDISPKKDAPVNLYYGACKGDKITMYLSTKKDKPIDKITISQNEKEIFAQVNVNPTQKIEFTSPETNFIEFTFIDRNEISVKIERYPANEESKNFNTFIAQTKKYDTTYYKYKVDSVIGYDEIRTPRNFKVISSADYESVEIKKEKYNIKGGGTRGILITKPQALIQTDMKEQKLVGYQIMIMSEAGADKMWKYIGLGVDVGCLCMQLFLPAGGTVAALGVQTAFEMIGPQEGGEPVRFAIMQNQKNLDLFLKKDQNVRAYEFGLATNYSATWNPMDTVAIGMENLNTAVEINVTVAVFAIYQTTIWENVSQDIVTIKPKTVAVEKKRKTINNIKTWNFQK